MGSRIKKLLFCSVLILVVNATGPVNAQWPLEVKVAVSHSNLIDTRISDEYNGFGFPYLGIPDSLNGGFGLSADFRYLISENLFAGIKVGYDYTYLFQDDVLSEWNWRYWEDTYIEFIPGISVEEVNRTLRYNAGTDTTQFSAVFVPTQRLRELKISATAGYRYALSNNWALTLNLDFGASLFSRQLKMEEKWIKRFKLDPDSEQKYDYEYNLDLLHYAPSKNGTRFFLAPSFGVRYILGENLSLELDAVYNQYLSSSQVGFLEDLFGIPVESEKWFPINSKFLMQIGLVFAY